MACKHNARQVVWWVCFLALFLLPFVVPNVSAAEPSVPTIATSEPDYPPGAEVTLTGTNWQGDSAVTISVYDDLGNAWVDGDSAAVQTDGTLSYRFSLPDWYVATYSVTAIGAETGRVAKTTFTDDAPVAPKLSSPPDGYRTRDNTVYLDWTEPAGATSYHVRVDTSSPLSFPYAFEAGSVHGALTASFITTPALPDGKYFWQVRAYGSTDGGTYGWSAWSGIWGFSVDTVPPEAPTLLSPADGATTYDATPTLDWSDVVGAASYEYQIDDDWELDSPSLRTGKVSDSQFTLSAMSAESDYYWRVRAVDAAENVGPWSPVRHFYLDLPEAPTLLSPADGAITYDATPTLDWSDVAGAASYTYQIDDDWDLDSPSLRTGTVTNSQVMVSPLFAPGDYYWRVRAVNDGGDEGDWSTVRDFHLDLPKAPTLLAPAAGASITDVTPTLDWSDVEGALDYTYQIDDDWAMGSPTTGSVSNSQVTLSPLAAPEQYYWRVRGMNARGDEGPWSSTSDFRLELPSSEAPTDIALSNNTVAENAGVNALVGTLSGTDPTPGQSAALAFDLPFGVDDNAAFNISGTSLRATAPFDFETDSTYVATIRATDADGLTYDERFVISVVDVNEAPTITSNGGGATAAISVSDGTTAVTMVTATDPDAGTALIFSISGGADAPKFTIDDSTGELSFIDAPDFASPQDVGNNNVYDVTVRASDGALADTQAIAVRVTGATTTHILNYTAGPGGTITGDVTQTVGHGEDGTTVTAVPDTGYRFVRWSDGIATASRTDLDVTEDLTVVAEFALVAGDRWSDISDSVWEQTYRVTADEVASVAEGYPDGTFRPSLPVNRAQFSKMAVDGFALSKMSPATNSFADVPVTHFFYQWIEGGADAGILAGYPDGTFGPARNITRQQANTILGRYLSQSELASAGSIVGELGSYPSVAAWYEAEGEGVLAPFSDALQVAPVHAPFTAYLVYRGIVLGSTSGSGSYLTPLSNLTRAQAAVLIFRVK